MSNWSKRSLELKLNRLWDTKPGYQIRVAYRGADRFDIPDPTLGDADRG